MSFEPSLKAMRDLEDWECSCNARMVHSLSILSFYCYFRLNSTCSVCKDSFILTGQWSRKETFPYFYCHTNRDFNLTFFISQWAQFSLAYFVAWKWHGRKFNSTSVSRDRENKDWKVEWSVSRRYKMLRIFLLQFSFIVFFEEILFFLSLLKTVRCVGKVYWDVFEWQIKS